MIPTHTVGYAGEKNLHYHQLANMSGFLGCVQVVIRQVNDDIAIPAYLHGCKISVKNA